MIILTLLIISIAINAYLSYRCKKLQDTVDSHADALTGYVAEEDAEQEELETELER